MLAEMDAPTVLLQRKLLPLWSGYEVIKSLEDEMTLCDLGRVCSKALRHDAYSEAILLEKNLQQNVKPAYHSTRVKRMKYVKTLLRKMTPKIFKKEKSFTFEGVVDCKSNDSSGSSSLYPRQKRCILGRSGGDVAHFYTSFRTLCDVLRDSYEVCAWDGCTSPQRYRPTSHDSWCVG